jgi:long-chain acyl-CoA synthetase
MNEPLFRLWAATVDRSPGAVAVIEAQTGIKWSRRALAAGAGVWAAKHARALGGSTNIRRRVAMSVPNGAEWLQVFLGLTSAGAVPAPIDASEPEAAQVETALSIGATHLWREGVLNSLGNHSAKTARVGRHECLVKLTSASTGTSRGLPATHAQMAADGSQVCATMGIKPTDLNLASIPLGYSYGLGNLVLPLVLQGTPIVCASSALPQALASDIARFRPTVFPSVPPVLRALALSDVAARSLASLRLVISAGSPLEPTIARAFEARFGTRVHGFYGTSETGGVAFDRTGSATLEGRSVGTPLEGVTVRKARAGRFVISSAAVLGRGRFSPADKAAIGRNRELVLLGRTDRMVKVAGRRMDLSEIERALKALPGVQGALAHVAGGANPLLAAAVHSTLPASDIRRALRGKLASWKIPSRLVALAKFPVTSRGKPDGRKLRQILSAPRTETSISTLSAARQMSAPK